MDSGSCLQTYSLHSEAVRAARWAPCGQRILSGGFDCALHLTDLETGVFLCVVTPKHPFWSRSQLPRLQPVLGPWETGPRTGTEALHGGFGLGSCQPAQSTEPQGCFSPELWDWIKRWLFNQLLTCNLY